MKRVFVVMSLLLASLVGNLPSIIYASEIEGGKVELKYDFITINYKHLIRMKMETTSNQISNPQVCLTKTNLKDLIQILNKQQPKIKKLTNTAISEGVRNYEKGFGIIRIYRSYFNIDTDMHYIDHSSALGISDLACCPCFVVDSDGKCYVKISSTIGDSKIKDGGSSESIVTANTGAFGTQKVVGHSVVNQFKTVECGEFYLMIPVEELESFINQLKEAMNGFDKQKAVENLFK